MLVSNGFWLSNNLLRRRETFIIRKITHDLTSIALGLEKCLYMGNLDALRVCELAKECARMQWIMQKNEVADDFVITTNLQNSVREIIKWSTAELGISLHFQGDGTNAAGIVDSIQANKASALPHGDVILGVDPRYISPAIVGTLSGDPTEARKKLCLVSDITAQHMRTEIVLKDDNAAKRQAFLQKHKVSLPILAEN